MKTTKCLIAALLVLPIAVSAQTKSAPTLDSKTVRMPKFPQADFPKKAIAISDIQLIQSIDDSVVLGYVQKGFDGHVEQFRAEKPLTELLQTHIHKMYKDNYKDTGGKLVWHLKKLRVGERMNTFQSLAYAKIKADAFFSNDGQNYRQVASVDTVFIIESGADLTPWHGTHLENALKLLLHTSQKGMKEMPLASEAKPLSEILEINSKKKDYPIMTDGNYNEGAWSSFEDFLNNKPNFPLAEAVVVKKRKVKIIDRVDGSDTLQVWGICKKGELYRYYDDMLVPLEQHGDMFAVSNYVEKVNRKNKHMFAAAIFGGAIGVAIIAESSKHSPALVEDMSEFIKEKKLPEATRIDMQTGKLSF